MGRSQVVRQRPLEPSFVGPNPTAPAKVTKLSHLMGSKIFTEKLYIKGIVLAFFYFIAWNGLSAEEIQKVQVNSLPDGIKIQWSKTDNNQRNVLVKSESGMPRSVNDGKIIYDGAANSFTDANLEVGKKYYYRRIICRIAIRKMAN